MGKMEIAPLSRPPREPREFPWTRALLAMAVILLAWVGYQQATKPKEKEPEKGWLLPLLKPQKPQVVYVVEKPASASPSAPPKAEQASELAPVSPAVVIHERVQDMPVKADAVAVLPPAPRPVPKKQETWNDIATRCLEFSGALVTTDPIVRPASVIVELHTINRCPDNFPGEHVWATAFVTGEQSGVVGSDFGHFSGTIVGYGNAWTRLEVACNPDLARSVVVRLRYFTP